jgi:hypothetical protein
MEKSVSSESRFETNANVDVCRSYILKGNANTDTSGCTELSQPIGRCHLSKVAVLCRHTWLGVDFYGGDSS